ncbi:NADH dehydrogenase 1 beta subcomplex subunit 5, mitochondrial [Trichonephila inaurata madagascariensis]|uniref:NADH dehydrogenase [ubiquinone] 1 beta subcomplex subunit 5, mitochondrial n=1 Tax=Trichonephila inaurata madagascariensis TaxID=2747483 RepID=A0A8X6WXX8_9ARAC|nr:NADH dehydrogenase 1 beta subcomplex subunit 5, mitochondrial [Trichonephila inaurata madagascariensis]
MIVFSTLRNFNTLASSSIKKVFLSNKKHNAIIEAIRKMSDHGDRTMYITSSRFQYTKFKDDLHFYVSLGAIPLILLILYTNIFIGPATLTEIPEGYEPKHWEYYKHPISRFIAKHFHEDPQLEHEKVLHLLWEEQENWKWSDTIRKVKALMAERDDYKAWYYIPSEQGRHIRWSRKETDELLERLGYR